MSGSVSSSARCWICGERATTREHKIKRSDVSKVFGEGPWTNSAAPLHVGGVVPRAVQSPNSKILKYPINLCSVCNSARSQRWDLGYSQAVAEIERALLTPGPEPIVDTDADQRIDWLGFYLYMLKFLGCQINDIGDDVPVGLRDALMSDGGTAVDAYVWINRRLALANLPFLSEALGGLNPLIREDSKSRGKQPRYAASMQLKELEIGVSVAVTRECQPDYRWRPERRFLQVNEVDDADFATLMQILREYKFPPGTLDLLRSHHQSGEWRTGPARGARGWIEKKLLGVMPSARATLR